MPNSQKAGLEEGGMRVQFLISGSGLIRNIIIILLDLSAGRHDLHKQQKR